MKVADIIISYLCASGLNPGIWMECLRRKWPKATATDCIIRGRDGTAWTSQYYRRTHLYAWLHQMQAEGNPFLQAFSSERGNRIEDKYYSMGTYRWGGRSSSTKRNNGTAQATPDEVYEHGRWRHKISKENMPT
jgi:hypothetical protein